MSEILIREARLEDVDAVLALERETAGAPHWAREEYVRVAEPDEGAAVRRVLLIAEGDQAAVVGFAVGAVIGRDVGAVGELESVAVAEEWRRRGVGRNLCMAVISWCAAEGAGVVELEVRASSAGVQGLYRELGFAEVGRRRGYYHETVEDAVLMMKEIRCDGERVQKSGG